MLAKCTPEKKKKKTNVRQNKMGKLAPPSQAQALSSNTNSFEYIFTDSWWATCPTYSSPLPYATLQPNIKEVRMLTT